LQFQHRDRHRPTVRRSLMPILSLERPA
jgi:hypothetical protein